MKSDPEFVFVYTTMPDNDVAKTLSVGLVEEKLAACVNIYAPMTSVYEWEGKIEAGLEVPVFIKTRADLVSKVIAFARPRHPYTVPCFLVLPIIAGNDDYLSWARQQTQKKSS
jgi:periplasmic divalent cation tolerance protein